VAVGSCSATAQRLPALEADLIGRSLDDLRAAGTEIIVPGHLAPLMPITDVRGSADYRLEAAATLCVRALHMAIAQGENAHG
jgi:CO/xanthine dehydrogenase FAD-binding subunit